MALFCSLFSSSSGNCTYIGDNRGGVLIDMGVSAKRVEAALEGIGIQPQNIFGLFITHEHSDHTKGIKAFASKYGTPVFASNGTLEKLDEEGLFDKPIDAYVLPKAGVEIEGMCVKPFATSHDCSESNGYVVITADGKKITVCTDLGYVSCDVKDAAKGCDLILLESNYDESMLKMGPYPPFLKRRILSDCGHLSNDDCAQFALELMQNGTRNFVLGHLSKENNIPSLAFATTDSVLKTEAEKLNIQYRLTVSGDLNKPITI